MPNGDSWPRISIVTPSFNQGKYIEETIRSVLLQGYPDFEYIVIDGGSTDASADIIKKYEKWLTYWVSEPDKGQTHAINKGFAKASGGIYAYINSDDLYCPGAFGTIAPIFAKNGEPHLVAGECVVLNGDIVKRVFEPSWPENPSYFLEKTYSSTFAQPASFWSREMYQELGGFDESLHFCFDREFFLRMGLEGVIPYLISKRIACFREHSDSKTIDQAVYFHKDSISILHKHADRCGLCEKARRKIVRHTNNEIRYSEIFTKWKNRGRSLAILDFLFMITTSPSLIFERKILGQARRLVTFRAEDVLELK
jgi:glycosyltransferase involved in cell wall biosynthesis